MEGQSRCNRDATAEHVALLPTFDTNEDKPQAGRPGMTASASVSVSTRTITLRAECGIAACSRWLAS
jgi:hypothetical protein